MTEFERDCENLVSDLLFFSDGKISGLVAAINDLLADRSTTEVVAALSFSLGAGLAHIPPEEMRVWRAAILALVDKTQATAPKRTFTL